METLTPPEASPERPLSQRQYAMWRKRRGLSGGSHVAVGNAVRSGRLRESVDADRRIIDVALADAEWVANTDLSEAPVAVVAAHARVEAPPREEPASVPGESPRATAVRKSGSSAAAPQIAGSPEPVAVLGASLSENNAAKVYWQARQAELKFRREAGELVPVAEVRGELETVFRTCQTRLLGIPTRAVSDGLVDVSGAARLEALIREALEDLAKGEGT